MNSPNLTTVLLPPATGRSIGRNRTDQALGLCPRGPDAASKLGKIQSPQMGRIHRPLRGVVQEFRFTNPHTFIYLAVKQDDGSTVTWSLEGQSPGLLVREGWTSRTLKPGDELRMRIAPLRSGAPGGAWAADQISFRDGRALEVSHRTVGFPESSDVTR